MTLQQAIDKYFKTSEPEPTPTEDTTIKSEPPIKRPKYYAIIKPQIKYHNVAQYGGQLKDNYYYFEADIMDRDKNKVVGRAFGPFKQHEDYPSGLQKLTEQVEVKIKEIVATERRNAAIQSAILDTQIALDGMVWFFQ